MFDNWPDEFAPSLRRIVDPPVPVTVDLGRALPTDGARFGANQLPLRVRAGGLDISGRVPGLLYAWARTSGGDWIGLVEFSVHTGNERGRLDMRQWCSRRAIEDRRADPGAPADWRR